MLTGLSGKNAAGGGGGSGYMGQLADAQQALESAKAEEEQTRVKLEMAKKELAEQEKRYKALEKDAGEGRAALDRLRKELEALKAKVDRSGWSEEMEREAGEKMRVVKEEERRAEQVRPCLLCVFRIFSTANLDFRNWIVSSPACPTSPSTTSLHGQTSIQKMSKVSSLL